MSGTVLITGASGLVGSPTVAQFAAAGWQVVAVAHRAAIEEGSSRVTVRRADLTDPVVVDRLVAEVSPEVIVHLAAVIPPQIYRDPAAGRRVNVDATRALLRAAESLPRSPRFVHASSGSVYGTRNPYRYADRLTAETPVRPFEIYGFHKLEAEELVRSSGLEWVVLRIGGVMSADPAATPFDSDTLYFGGCFGIDQRCHTVDNRDVASAFVAAATADVIGEILLIAGDDTHLLRQGELTQSLAAARGLAGYPLGRPGDPNSDDGWYPYGDWMDVTRAQQVLSFQHHSWPEMLAELRANVGWRVYPTRLLAPLARMALKRQAVYRNTPGAYTDVWTAVRTRFGEPISEPGRHPT
ncbi:oxidoreductase [Mycobacteriaceae bacterium 1482268.1]|nr:oxidoreductase [Mycobacteriaceae bacterium 1482268.1]